MYIVLTLYAFVKIKYFEDGVKFLQSFSPALYMNGFQISL